jgi:hypothetical protein
MTEIEKKEQLEWDLQCYGCTSQSMHEYLKKDITAKLTGGYTMVVAGLMSDAQEEIEHNDPERARQTLNRAKFVLFNYVMKESD